MRKLTVGTDPNGIRRIWCDHQNSDVAETVARKDAEEYIKHRPDTGPLSRWTFERVEAA